MTLRLAKKKRKNYGHKYKLLEQKHTKRKVRFNPLSIIIVCINACAFIGICIAVPNGLRKSTYNDILSKINIKKFSLNK